MPRKGKRPSSPPGPPRRSKRLMMLASAVAGMEKHPPPPLPAAAAAAAASVPIKMEKECENYCAAADTLRHGNGDPLSPAAVAGMEKPPSPLPAAAAAAAVPIKIEKECEIYCCAADNLRHPLSPQYECGHINTHFWDKFCNDWSARATQEGNSKCSTVDYSGPAPRFVPSPFLQAVMDVVEVVCECPNAKSGCEKWSPASQMNNHLQVCNFK